MSKRARAAAATLILASGAAAAVAIPAMTGAQPDGERTITVRMKVVNGSTVQHRKRTGSDTLATGDGLLVRLTMHSPAGARIGSAYADCVNVGPRARAIRATLQCTQTYRFADGQIVTAGVVRFSRLEGLSVAVVGGSGAYSGARGELVSGKPAKGYASVDVLRLED